MEFQSGCVVCGKELVYLAEKEVCACYYCGAQDESDVYCINRHYVCDACHRKGPEDLIETYCSTSQQMDPLQIALVIMQSPAVKMHGPEYHFLVPAALLTAYYNQRGESAEKLRKLRQARKRSEKVLGGFCGFYGDCGAAVGTGIFISLVTGATPLSGREWSLANRMTAHSLLNIAEHGGPRCCKRNTYLALITAVDFLSEHFNISLPLNRDICCQFSDLNAECRLGDCPFHCD